MLPFPAMNVFIHPIVPSRPLLLLSLVLSGLAAIAAAQPVLQEPTSSDGYTGHPLDLNYTVQWEGEPADYAIFPAVVEVPEGLTAKVVAGDARKVGNTVSVTQTVRLQTERPFSGELPPVTISWAATAALTQQPEVVRNTLVSQAVPLQFRDYEVVRRNYVGVGMALALGAGAVGFVFLWRRKRRASAPVAGLTPAERFRAALHTARQHRLDGDYYGYYRALSGAAKLTPDSTLAERLGRRARAVGYQGVKPTDDELDGDFKDVERAFAGSREAASL